MLSAPLTGSALSFLQLAYNIYLLGHNVNFTKKTEK